MLLPLITYEASAALRSKVKKNLNLKNHFMLI